MIVRLIRAVWRQLGPGPGPWNATVSADMAAEQAQWEKRFERGSPDFCGGLFHRPLSGFVMSRDEMDGLLATPSELDAVFARLDPTLSHDLLVAGFIHLLREPPLTQDAQAAFKAAARAAAEFDDGNIWQMRLGSFYADWLAAASLSQRIALLEKMDHYRMPVAGALLGYALLEAARETQGASAATTIARAREFLQTAADHGDRQAEFDLARIDTDGALHTESARMDDYTLRRAGNKGHVLAMLHVAWAARTGGDAKTAFDWSRRAALEDPRFFRRDVAIACFWQGELTERRPGATRLDVDAARDWYAKAAELGHADAIAALARLDAARP